MASISWIVGLCSVAFDVDEGQKVQHVVPEGIISEEEKVDIGFHAFPDSMSMELQGRSAIRDSSFMMRVRRRGKHRRPPKPLPFNRRAAGAVTVPEDQAVASSSPDVDNGPPGPRYLYGFVFCRQRQDETLRRGGEQISVAVLSEHPLSGVLRPLSQVAGPLYFSSGFSSGLAALERVYQEVMAWPPPVSGPLLQLQVGYSALSCRLPHFSTLPGPSNLYTAELTANGNLGRLNMKPCVSAEPVSARAADASQRASLSVSTTTQSGSSPNIAQQNVGTAPQLTSPSVDDALTAPNGSDTAAPGEGVGPEGGVAQAAEGTGAAECSAGSAGGEDATTGQSPTAVSSLPQVVTEEPAGPAAPLTVAASAPPGMAAAFMPESPLHESSSDGDVAAAMRSVMHLRRMSVAPGGSDAQLVNGAFYELDIFTPLQPQLQQLWHLWEISLCGKPLMVVAPSPGDTSNTVAALISLIAPVPYSADFRPYYTIQDAAFRRLAAGELPDASGNSVPTMIGITNLYFLRALPHWPSVLAVGKKESHAANWTTSASSVSSGASALLPAMAMAFNPSNAVKALRQRAAGAQALLGGHIENMWSSYKPVCRPDQVLLLRLLQLRPGDVKSKASRIALANSETIRRHFHELTAAFLAPFVVYFEPGPRGTVPAWSPEAFLLEQRAAAPAALLLERMGSVANLVELYARFTSSVNFTCWFEMRRAPVAHLEEKAPPALDGFGVFAAAVQHMEEVERIQMFFSVEQQLQEAQMEASSPEAPPEVDDTVARLKRELLVLFVGMPEDLQQTCVSSPARCELLLSLGLTGEQRTRMTQLLAQLRAGTQAWPTAAD